VAASCWIDLNLGSVKLSLGLPLFLIKCSNRGCPTRYWAVGPRRQRLYKWACEPRFVGSLNPTLSSVPISRGVRQRWEDPLQSFHRHERWEASLTLQNFLSYGVILRLLPLMILT
jgi:hypothetical protein